MEEDVDPEYQRLRKLVEDSIIQAEKEKMAILQGSCNFHEDISAGNPQTCSYVKTSQPMKTFSHAKKSPSVKTYSHATTSPPTKQARADIDPKDVHSHLCMLKNMESLLAINNKRGLLSDSKNRYIPCAIPLSPPIRLKKDEDVNLQSSSRIHNTGLDHSLHKPVSESTFHSTSAYTLKHTCGTSLNDHTYKQFSPVHTCEKSSNYIHEKRFSSVPVFHPERNTEEIAENLDLQRDDQKPLLVVQDKNFANFRNSNVSLFSGKNTNDSPERKEIFGRKPDERKEESVIENPVSKHSKSISRGEDEKDGFHFQVSLDANSTKDVINKMLQKIPDIIDKFGTSSHDIINSHDSVKEQPQMNEQVFHPYTSNIPGPSKIFFQPKESTSIYTQTVSGDHSYSITQRPIKISDTQSKINSESTQTDINSEDLLPKKNELQHLIKDIVLQTLEEIQICKHVTNAKCVSPIHKVDSGIQSEVESDGIKNGPFQDQQNCKPHKENEVLSKGVQTEMDALLTTPAKNVQDNSSFTTGYPEHSFDELKEAFSTTSDRKESTGHKFSERNSTPLHNPRDKMEMMLEKIYEHVCQEKETSRNFNDISFQNPVNTRDVAVQFNPLHTSTKSTLTLEIKHKDSACQSDIPFKMHSDQNPFLDASVQVEFITEPVEDNKVLKDASTQCEQKNTLNACAQTETLMNLEYSATNTSASTTPVSDSLFMDDLISEGEIPLPWNLRLLSDSGGSISIMNPDSTDTSAREKDYSLSEGEIPPHTLRYWSLCTNLENEDAKKHDGSYCCGRSIELQSFNSSLSEGEYNINTSLSLGEVPHDFRASTSYSSSRVENHPSLKCSPRRDKLHCDNLPTNICSQTRDVFECSQNSDNSVQEHENENVCGKTDIKNLSQGTLPTVEEEIHSVDDQ